MLPIYSTKSCLKSVPLAYWDLFTLLNSSVFNFYNHPVKITPSLSYPPLSITLSYVSKSSTFWNLIFVFCSISPTIIEPINSKSLV